MNARSSAAGSSPLAHAACLNALISSMLTRIEYVDGQRFTSDGLPRGGGPVMVGATSRTTFIDILPIWIRERNQRIDRRGRCDASPVNQAGTQRTCIRSGDKSQ
jgi:hypothetical protein